MFQVLNKSDAKNFPDPYNLAVWLWGKDVKDYVILKDGTPIQLVSVAGLIEKQAGGEKLSEMEIHHCIETFDWMKNCWWQLVKSGHSYQVTEITFGWDGQLYVTYWLGEYRPKYTQPLYRFLDGRFKQL